MHRHFFAFVLTAAFLTGVLLVSLYATESHLLPTIHLPSRTGSSSKHETNADLFRNVEIPKAPLRPPTATEQPVKPATTLLDLPVHKSEPETKLEPGPELEPEPESEPRIIAPDTSKATLVVSSVADSNNSWIYEEVGDLLEPYGSYSVEIYANNNISALLHTPANKGHEAMVYLTYIIDTYYNLPPVTIFIHDHPTAWHNNIILDMSTVEMLRNLRLDQIEQNGYFNLRCHWNPGCPVHLFPFATEFDVGKAEELIIKDAWMQVFEVEEDQVPRAIGQVCCSQFAVTADRIRSLPLDKYIHFRNWLLDSELSDFMTGRVFEYAWQYIFIQTPIFCPDSRICYCEGYGVCFETPEDYDKWFDLFRLWREYKYQLEILNKEHEKGDGGGDEHQKVDGEENEHQKGEGEEERQEEEKNENQNQNKTSSKPSSPLNPGPITNYHDPYNKTRHHNNTNNNNNNNNEDESHNTSRTKWLSQQLDDLVAELAQRKDDALARGRDPDKRLAAVEAARAWGKFAEWEDKQHGGWQR